MTIYDRAVIPTHAIRATQRFEQRSLDKSAARKIEAPVRFPVTLNMAPYTTLVMHKQEQLKDAAAPVTLIP